MSLRTRLMDSKRSRSSAESVLPEGLEQHDVILVSGPQRSGTRIGAKILAHELGYEYVDENDIGIDSLNRLCHAITNLNKVVIQCPALARYVHLLASERVAAVFMIRDVRDIIASQERIGWKSVLPELLRYDRTEGEPCIAKYAFWQQVKGEHCYSLEYESLSGHPLWVDKELRKNFGPLQTELNPNSRTDT